MNKALVEGKYFRVHPISKIIDIKNGEPVIETRPIYCGLNIEKKQDDYYYVVVSIRPGIEGGIELHNIGFRPVDIIDESMSIEDFWEMMQEYKNCVEFAANTVADEVLRGKEIW